MSPWDRLPEEPNLWFDRFMRFRLMGVRRSVRAVYLREFSQKADEGGEKPPAAWYEAAKEWRWRERAEAWDETERERIRQEWRAFAVEWRGKERRIAEALLEKAEQMLQFPVAKISRVIAENGDQITQIVEPADWRFTDVTRLADTASKLARLAAELETQRQRVEIEEVDDLDDGQRIKRLQAIIEVLQSRENQAAGEAISADEAEID